MKGKEYYMNLGEFIIQKGEEKGLDKGVIARILMNAQRKLPGNVPEERWEEQVMIWINNAAAKQREETSSNEPIKENNGIDTSILGGQAPLPQFQNNGSATFNEFGEIIREDIEEQDKRINCIIAEMRFFTCLHFHIVLKEKIRIYFTKSSFIGCVRLK